MKYRLTERAEVETPELDEDALRKFYTALVASGVDQEPLIDSLKRLGAPEGKGDLIGWEQRKVIVEGLAKRFIASSSAPLETGVTFRGGKSGLALKVLDALDKLDVPSTSRVVGFSSKGKEKEDLSPLNIPLGLVGRSEWDALFEEFVSCSCRPSWSSS